MRLNPRLMHGSPQYGDRVLVSAQTIRVIGRIEEGVPVFRQAVTFRDAGRHARYDFEEAQGWPGAPLDMRVEPGPEGFVLEPELGTKTWVRLRRLVSSIPEAGVVVGFTRKDEGTRIRGRGDNVVSLVGPGRKVSLLEVAMPTSSKARIVLVHPSDLFELAAIGAA